MPAVAGRFYAAEPEALKRDVAGYLAAGAGTPRAALAVMAPHAGLVYSGGVAGQVFAAVEVPKRVIVLCPNHTGRGAKIAVITEGAFRIPGADVPIDTELAAA
ncbi:MAG TPA: AmmeMemoRadiSam system protein B, partial [Kofleriaceae bacterium]|nr:AmmeMemoRadiSam system protein B [Kofleriaceae bacterium]